MRKTAVNAVVTMLWIAVMVLRIFDRYKTIEKSLTSRPADNYIQYLLFVRQDGAHLGASVPLTYVMMNYLVSYRLIGIRTLISSHYQSRVKIEQRNSTQEQAHEVSEISEFRLMASPSALTALIDPVILSRTLFMGTTSKVTPYCHKTPLLICSCFTLICTSEVRWSHRSLQQ
jgi:hypothetical protein